MARSFRGASCTKPSKDILRAHSYIQDTGFGEIIYILKYFRSILDVSLELKYAVAFFPRKSAKMQTLKQIVRISV